ncbi:MAG TPA: hypothetical protein VF329_06220 [Gammaproteobacteria bacterium]
MSSGENSPSNSGWRPGGKPRSARSLCTGSVQPRVARRLKFTIARATEGPSLFACTSHGAFGNAGRSVTEKNSMGASTVDTHGSPSRSASTGAA